MGKTLPGQSQARPPLQPHNCQIRIVTGRSVSQSRPGSQVVPTVRKVGLWKGGRRIEEPGEHRLQRREGHRGTSRTKLFKEPRGVWRDRRQERLAARRLRGSGGSGNRASRTEKCLLPRAPEPFPKIAGPGRNRRAGSSPSLSRPPPDVVLFLPAPRRRRVPTPQKFRIRELRWWGRRG